MAAWPPSQDGEGTISIPVLEPWPWVDLGRARAAPMSLPINAKSQSRSLLCQSHTLAKLRGGFRPLQALILQPSSPSSSSSPACSTPFPRNFRNRGVCSRELSSTMCCFFISTTAAGGSSSSSGCSPCCRWQCQDNPKPWQGPGAQLDVGNAGFEPLHPHRGCPSAAHSSALGCSGAGDALNMELAHQPADLVSTLLIARMGEQPRSKSKTTAAISYDTKQKSLKYKIHSSK